MLPALIPFVPRTKLRPPRLPHDILLRTRLLERLDRPQALTLIVAPAGYGKTTLAGSWVAHCSRPTAWVSLDDEDSTLAVFVQRLVMAVRSVFPAFGEEILSLVASPRELAPEMVLPGPAQRAGSAGPGLCPGARRLSSHCRQLHPSAAVGPARTSAAAAASSAYCAPRSADSTTHSRPRRGYRTACPRPGLYHRRDP